MKFYAACLASYNNGVLHGAFIDAENDVDSMQEQVNKMLRASKYPNVMVECAICEGTKEKTFHNSETGATRQGACYECNGVGKVPSAEEYAIHDFEGLPTSFGEYCGLQAIADFVELTEKYDHIDSDDLAAIVDDFGNVDTATEQLEDSFVGIYEAFKDYADETADEMLNSHDIKDDSPLSRYFDYQAFARDLAMDMHTISVSNGIAVFYA